MAGFKTHVSFGVASGVLMVIALSSAGLHGDVGFVFAVAGLAVIGSILPDMDSDSGLPFHIAFGSLSIICSVLVLYWLVKNGDTGLRDALLWASGAGAFIWLFVGNIFKRFTRHRGITHSLPATLLLGLITFFTAKNFIIEDAKSFILATAVMVGFLMHLVLDEIWAAFNFNGTPFIPNKALGSAVKLFSNSTFVNLAVYGAIVFLAAGNWSHFWELGRSLWENVSK